MTENKKYVVIDTKTGKRLREISSLLDLGTPITREMMFDTIKKWKRRSKEMIEHGQATSFESEGLQLPFVWDALVEIVQFDNFYILTANIAFNNNENAITHRYTNKPFIGKAVEGKDQLTYTDLYIVLLDVISELHTTNVNKIVNELFENRFVDTTQF